MKNMKKTCLILAMLLVCSLLPVSASAGDGFAAKEEVVYANLKLDGSVSNAYVVNIISNLDSSSSGTVTDYGDYTSLKNLTNMSEITQDGDKIIAQATSGSFYYQGELGAVELPWGFDITYTLDGEEMTSDELAGAQGALKITIAVTQNMGVNPVFFENYMLQISVTLDTELCAEISADGATVANAGKNKLINFTVMPNTESDFLVTATVKDFEMAGIDISAVPYSMDVEIPETDEMTEGFSDLSDAISQLNDGIRELRDGASEMSSGAGGLASGSKKFASGLNSAAKASDPIVSGSAKIKSSLEAIAAGLAGTDGDLGLGALTQLPSGLTQLAGTLTSLGASYSSAYSALDSEIAAIPSAAISQGDLDALAAEVSTNSATLNSLISYYQSAAAVKVTYSQVSAAFAAVSPALTTVAQQLNSIASQISSSLSSNDTAQQLTQLANGLQQLSSSYAIFHSGLASYTDGVKQLNTSYSAMNSGISEFARGTSELFSGVSELKEGTQQLTDETANMAGTVQEEIDKALEAYTSTDFELESFVSSKNTGITSVQFVFATEKIEIPEVEQTEEDPDPGSFWSRLLDLFR